MLRVGIAKYPRPSWRKHKTNRTIMLFSFTFFKFNLRSTNSFCICVMSHIFAMFNLLFRIFQQQLLIVYNTVERSILDRFFTFQTILKIVHVSSVPTIKKKMCKNCGTSYIKTKNHGLDAKSINFIFNVGWSRSPPPPLSVTSTNQGVYFQNQPFSLVGCKLDYLKGPHNFGTKKQHNNRDFTVKKKAFLVKNLYYFPNFTKKYKHWKSFLSQS